MKMICIQRVPSPMGEITLAGDGEAITGLWFADQRYFGRGLEADTQERELPVLDRARQWLEAYFSGREPGALPPLRLEGTAFQKRVWQALLTVPRGERITYGELARTLGSSPRAVGGAVGKNPISILVPCHRVVGAAGSLGGYAGGMERKKALLALEEIKN